MISRLGKNLERDAELRDNTVYEINCIQILEGLEGESNLQLSSVA